MNAICNVLPFIYVLLRQTEKHADITEAQSEYQYTLFLRNDVKHQC